MGHNVTGFLRPKACLAARVKGRTLPGQIRWGEGTSSVNITKGSEIAVVKELQPSVLTSCCREDRHANNQVDIKSKATTNYLWRYIYQTGMRTDHVCTCLVTLGVDNES